MEQYKVHNGSRDPETRTLRASNANHRGLKLFIPIGQQRVIRGRPVVVTEQQLGENIKEMQALQDAGLIYVTTMDERVVDLHTGERAPRPGEPPAPKPPLDDAAKDNVGGQEPLSMYAQEAPPPNEFSMPVPPPLAAFEDPVVPPSAPAPAAEPEPTLEESLDDAIAQQEELESAVTMPDLIKPTTIAPPSSKKKGHR